MSETAQGARIAREKKGGRPRMSPLTRRTVGMRLWASYAERNAIHAKARAAHMTVGEYVRAAALSHPVTVVSVPPVTVEARRDLAAIGHHLNRIVRAVEASGGEAVPSDLLATLVDLRTQVDALALAMATPLVVTAKARG